MGNTFTPSAGDQMRPYRNTHTVGYPESQTQTFIVGDVLVFDTAAGKQHKVKKGGTDPASIVGVAAEAASGTEGNKVMVYVADERAEFRARYATGQASTSSDLGTVYGITNDTTNKIWCIDNTKTSNTRVVITEFINGSAPGDTGAEVAFRFMNAFGNSGGNREPYRE